ncbi:hypothetical protein NMY22_g8073 [Coprinellus aureogranulatus]|nr:hypothetical protein NMY22_g8073 [Coprinellus aureogranulatus]
MINQSLVTEDFKIEPIVIQPLERYTTHRRYPHLEGLGARLVLVEVPGLDPGESNKNRSDLAKLKGLATWLSEIWFAKGSLSPANIGGIVYLHDITLDRAAADIPKRYIPILGRLLPFEIPLTSVLLVTTKWRNLEPSVDGEAREKELDTEHWATLTRPKQRGREGLGATVMRFGANHTAETEGDDALTILHLALSHADRSAGAHFLERCRRLRSTIDRRTVRNADFTRKLRQELDASIRILDLLSSPEKNASALGGRTDLAQSLKESVEDLERLTSQLTTIDTVYIFALEVYTTFKTISNRLNFYTRSNVKEGVRTAYSDVRKVYGNSPKCSRPKRNTCLPVYIILLSGSLLPRTMARYPNPGPPSDSRLSDAKDTDIVIPVIGDTGAGKSYFINQVLRSLGQKDQAAVGESLSACTQGIDPIVIEGQTRQYTCLRDRRIILVDCPGFDTDMDTSADFQILKRLATWLKQSYPKGTVLGGIVYMHDISVTRSQPDGFQKKLAWLNQLYDDKVPFSAVVFVTSKWGREEEETCVKREQEYQDVHWKNVLNPAREGEKGARVMRLKASSKTEPKPEEESAWEVITSILKEMENRAVKGLLTEVRRIERSSIRGQDAKAAAELRTALERMKQAEDRLTVLKEGADQDGESDAERRKELGEAEENVQALSQRIQKLAYSLLGQLSRLSRWLFSS